MKLTHEQLMLGLVALRRRMLGIRRIQFIAECFVCYIIVKLFVQSNPVSLFATTFTRQQVFLVAILSCIIVYSLTGLRRNCKMRAKLLITELDGQLSQEEQQIVDEFKKF